MYKIGLSTCGKKLCEDLFKNFHEAGITAMEISLEPEDYDGINYEVVKKWADKYNVDLRSFHFPFAPFTKIDISNRGTCKYTIKYFEELIKKLQQSV